MGTVFYSFLVVVDQFNVKSVLPFKAENDAPIGPHCHRPQPLQVAFQRMQAIAREIQSLRRRGGIENRKDSFNRLQKVGAYPASVVAFIEAFQAPMLELLITLRITVK
jgi:hypothetical protein